MTQDIPAVAAVKNELVNSLEIDESEAKIVSVEENEWPNSCLGLAGEEEMCAQVIVPGYLVTLEVDGEEYRFRTDKNGTIVRQEIAE